MSDNRSSFTASMVAFGRGLGGQGLPGDPWAAQLVPPGFSHLLKASSDRRWLRGLLAKASCGLATHMAMRTAVIDRALVAAVERGIVQVVILGAGLDARALRLEALRNCRVFEVDQLATQEAKHLGLTRVPDNLTFVPVDFESDTLAEQLVSAGHEPTWPTAWVMEGVTMYLSRAAIAETLSGVATLSAPGSTLLVTYAHKGKLIEGERIAALSRGVFHFSGEYLRSWFAAGEFANLLRVNGFTVHSDRSDRDWAAELGVGRFFSGLFKVEHLIEARC